MTNFNSQDDQATDAKGGFANSDQEFSYTEERKPVNRNLIVLLLIAAVGGGMVYLMYLRGRFNADTQTAEQIEASKQVSDWSQTAAVDLEKMNADLIKTKKAVDMLQTDHAVGQVPVNNLRGNPFAFGEKQASKGPDLVPIDPMEAVRKAVAKANVQMIIYSGQNSTAQINNWEYKLNDRLTIDSVPFTVKSITRTGVVLSNPLGDFTIEPASAKGIQGN